MQLLAGIRDAWWPVGRGPSPGAWRGGIFPLKCTAAAPGPQNHPLSVGSGYPIFKGMPHSGSVTQNLAEKLLDGTRMNPLPRRLFVLFHLLLKSKGTPTKRESAPGVVPKTKRGSAPSPRASRLMPVLLYVARGPQRGDPMAYKKGRVCCRCCHSLVHMSRDQDGCFRSPASHEDTFSQRGVKLLFSSCSSSDAAAWERMEKRPFPLKTEVITATRYYCNYSIRFLPWKNVY